MDDLIKLLEREADFIEPILENPLRNETAYKSCTYIEFIAMVQKIISSILPNCKFVSDDEIYTLLFPDKPLDQSVISFKIHERTPYQEIKPQMRHEVIEDDVKTNERRIGTLYAQRMRYILQFNIFSSGYEKSESVMNIFEDAILDYTGYFKKNGIVEILFRKQLEDEGYEHFRKMCSMRHLRYELILEKQWIDFESVLETVQINP